MNPTNNLQKAFVLHYRNYSETSLLVDLLTEHEGRIGVIAKGARRPKSPFRGILQPFIFLEASWRGRGELPTLHIAEFSGAPIQLVGKRSFSGFYLNELLTRVLHRHDPCENIFNLYEKTIKGLASEESEQILLRQFEKNLLQQLGYGLQLIRDANSHLPIEENKTYYFVPDHGFTCVRMPISQQARANTFLGEHLLSIAKDNYENKDILIAAKRLMRLAFQPLLGDRPLKSRELFLAADNLAADGRK